jgi:hypothetical protein
MDPKPARDDVARAIKDDESIGRACGIFRAHRQKAVAARFEEHVMPMHEKFLDFDRLFLPASRNARASDADRGQNRRHHPQKYARDRGAFEND